jgi:hypothetical protein
MKGVMATTQMMPHVVDLFHHLHHCVEKKNANIRDLKFRNAKTKFKNQSCPV